MDQLILDNALPVQQDAKAIANYLKLIDRHVVNPFSEVVGIRSQCFAAGVEQTLTRLSRGLIVADASGSLGHRSFGRMFRVADGSLRAARARCRSERGEPVTEQSQEKAHQLMQKVGAALKAADAQEKFGGLRKVVAAQRNSQ